ncbi:MAG: serine/threonine protein kinase [Actinomycetia bacterium]|nr:serine/threonine protein kinase [Actinomycetes bacterium]
MIGKRIKNFKLISILGKGGMSTVYLAKNIKTEKLVAAKILRSQFTKDSEHLKRFFTRQISLTNLDHPNIVKMLDYGREGSIYFLIYELIQGVSLDKYMQKKNLSLKEIVSISKKILYGLSYAHSKGIIHRDIKPQNILITEDGTVKITDFGIAKILSSHTITQTGAFIGSPGYVSPEQAEGKNLAPPSDIYSFGVMLFEMITGRLPFRSDTPWGVINQHIKSKPPDIKKFSKQVPGYLTDIVNKCLAKNAQDRFSSALEAIEAFNVRRQNNISKKPADTIIKDEKKFFRQKGFEKFWGWNSIIICSLEVIVVLIIYIMAILILNIINTQFSLDQELFSDYFLKSFLLLFWFGLSLGLYIYILGIIKFFHTIKKIKNKYEILSFTNINWLTSKVATIFILIFLFISGSDAISWNLFLLLTLILVSYYFISSVIYGLGIIRGNFKYKKGHNLKSKLAFLYSTIGIIFIIFLIIFFSINTSSNQMVETFASEKETEITEEIINEKIGELPVNLRENFRNIDDKEYLAKLLEDPEAVELCTDLVVWQKTNWMQQLVESGYTIDELKYIIKTVKDFSGAGGNDAYREEYLNSLISPRSETNLPELALEEQAELYKKLFIMQFPAKNVPDLFLVIKDSKYYNDFNVGDLDKLILTINKDQDISSEGPNTSIYLLAYEYDFDSLDGWESFYGSEAIVDGKLYMTGEDINGDGNFVDVIDNMEISLDFNNYNSYMWRIKAGLASNGLKPGTSLNLSLFSDLSTNNYCSLAINNSSSKGDSSISIVEDGETILSNLIINTDYAPEIDKIYDIEVTYSVFTNIFNLTVDGIVVGGGKAIHNWPIIQSGCMRIFNENSVMIDYISIYRYVCSR